MILGVNLKYHDRTKNEQQESRIRHYFDEYVDVDEIYN